MTNNAIRMIQTGLRDLSHEPGPLDGLFGPKTRAAAQAWLAAGGKAASKLAPSSPVGEIRQGSAGYLVTEAIVHCSATRPEWMAGARLEEQIAEIRRWHVVGNGWSDIGYHWIIARDGRVLPARPETRIGAHVIGRNRGTLGICLLGAFGASADDRFATHFTDRQAQALIALLDDLSRRTPIKRVSGHNEFAAKGCPGFNVPEWLAA